mgnify:CR=1 FL=1
MQIINVFSFSITATVLLELWNKASDLFVLDSDRDSGISPQHPMPAHGFPGSHVSNIDLARFCVEQFERLLLARVVVGRVFGLHLYCS